MQNPPFADLPNAPNRSMPEKVVSQPVATPRFSVVIPTFQRRELVLASIRALSRQEFDGTLEIIVVVDGSTDGTATALRELSAPVPFTVVEQPNCGASAARNRGAAAATGDILLFLDDDMEADPHLLAELNRSHREGADVVFGHLPLHPKSPDNFLSAGIKHWTDGRLKRLTTPDEDLTLHDLMTGQMSLSRVLFNQVGGFDTNFTLNGTFGDEDIDFGYRLMRDGYHLVFNARAISYQNYVVTPAQCLRQLRQCGNADVAFARKHPEQAKTIFALNGSEKPMNRWLWRPLISLTLVSAPLMNFLRWLALRLVAGGKPGPKAVKFYYQIHAMQYWRGVWEAGGMPRPRPLRVLAYHAICDLAGAPVIAPYCVPPETFRRHLDLLKRTGFHFVSPAEFKQFLHHGGGLPPMPVLLTFDDAYQDLEDVVLPILKERGIPAVVFAVSGQVGGTNQWDQVIGAPTLRLLSSDGLRNLASAGIEVGAHSRTHRPLTKLADDELADEIGGSVAELEAAGLDRPTLFAYPEGDYDSHVRDKVQAAGFSAAFTVIAGLVRPGRDHHEVPRIEVLRSDTGLRFLWKVIRAGRWSLNE